MLPLRKPFPALNARKGFSIFFPVKLLFLQGDE